MDSKDKWRFEISDALTSALSDNNLPPELKMRVERFVKKLSMRKANRPLRDSEILTHKISQKC